MSRGPAGAEASEEELLAQWLSTRLSQEREYMELRHSILLQEFREHHRKQEKVNDGPNKASDLAKGGSGTVSAAATSVTLVPVTSVENQAATMDPTVAPNMVESSGSQSKPKNNFVRSESDIHGTPTTGLGKLVMNSNFEICFATVIGVNILVMALEAQYVGFGIGHKLGYPTYDEEKEEVWPGGETAFLVLDYVFGVVYTIELILKVGGLRRQFCELVNMIDVLVVFFWFFEKVSYRLVPVDTNLLRMFRLLRILRLLKLIHTVAGLEHLLMMVTALKASLYMLTWAGMLLMGMLMLFAFVLNQALAIIVMENETVPMERRQECFMYFGNFSRSVLSMFELTLANWIPLARFLVDDISEFFIVFAIVFKLTLGFAVVGVINACFIKETFKTVATNRQLMVIEKNNERQVHARQMSDLIAYADEQSDSADGKLTKTEFESVCADPQIRVWLLAQGLDASDAGSLFELMDDGSGVLEVDEIVKGVARLKGPARSLDLVKLTTFFKTFEKQSLSHMAQLRQQQDRLAHIDAAVSMKQGLKGDDASGLATHLEAQLLVATNNINEQLASVQGQVGRMSDTFQGIREEVSEVRQFVSSSRVALDLSHGVAKPTPNTNLKLRTWEGSSLDGCCSPSFDSSVNNRK